MSNYATLAVHQVNKWVWESLKRDLAADFAAYLTPGSPVYGMIPIVPSNQTPETNNIEGGAPFIVYSYTLTGAANEWWTQAENVAYIIYDNNEARLRRIHNYLNQLLRRLDFTATEINAFLGNNSQFDIKVLMLTGGSGPDPINSENGRQSAMLTWRVDYTLDIDGRVVTDLADPAGMRR